MEFPGILKRIEMIEYDSIDLAVYRLLFCTSVLVDRIRPHA